MIEPPALADLRLPRGIHAAALTGRDVASGEVLARVVIWADRYYSTCPTCEQAVPREEGCPVILNTGAGQGGQLEPVNQQHGCGQWLSVLWEEVEPSGDVAGVSEGEVLHSAGELATRRGKLAEAERERVHGELKDQLRAALERLVEPLEPGETLEDRRIDIQTGNLNDPGVYWDSDDDRLVAWAYDPKDDNEAITVVEADLAVGQA